MKMFAFFNTKGGVGKSTLLVLIADLLASVKIAGRRAKVLVVDVDTQSSASIALIGEERVSLHAFGFTFGHILEALKSNKSFELDQFITRRLSGAHKSKRLKLGAIDVMSTSEKAMLDFNAATPVHQLPQLSQKLRESLKRYDFILFDLPSNLNPSDTLSMLVLLSCDRIIIPTESSKISLNALPNCFKLIRYVQSLAKDLDRAPQIAGVVLNKTDKRERSYRLHKQVLEALVEEYDTCVFDHFLPTASEFGTATDDSLSFEYIKEKYARYYEHIRQLTVEIVRNAG
jgi:chromosome partitioning protein